MACRPRITVFAFLWILYGPVLVSSQSPALPYNLKSDPVTKRKKCQDYFQIFRKLPTDIRYDVQEVDGQLVVFFRDKEIFQNLFDKKNDGIAIDMVRRNRYTCATDAVMPSLPRGSLLAPLWKKQLNEHMLDMDRGVYLDFGPVPSDYDPEDYEFNLVLIQKKYVCDYQIISNLAMDHWDLLETGLYRDSLDAPGKGSHVITQEVILEVPFDKSATAPDARTCKMLQDTLQVLGYQLQWMDICIYTSVEGSSEYNEKLQDARATAIIGLLSDYLKPDFRYSVFTDENWEQFITDIQKSEFAPLIKLPKAAIKEQLKKLDQNESMNVLLEKERKAVLTLGLEKDLTVYETPDELVEFFDKLVNRRQIREARYLQAFVLDMIREEQLPEDFIRRLEIPRATPFDILYNERALYNSTDDDQKRFLLDVFEDLAKRLPESGEIRYNLTTLQLRYWQMNPRISLKICNFFSVSGLIPLL